jgi:hypothetical protein
MSLPPTISDLVLPFVTPAIRGCSCGIDTVLANMSLQSVTRVSKGPSRFALAWTGGP